MPAKKPIKRTAAKQKKSLYKIETYGVKFDSVTFLIFSVFVLVCAVWLVSRMMGLNLF
jgi:hypothetical protein